MATSAHDRPDCCAGSTTRRGVRIHRGAHEISGSCIEIEHGEDRIVLDLGRPLSAGWEDDVPLPDIRGLASQDHACSGLSWAIRTSTTTGSLPNSAMAVPVYMGAEAANVLAAASFFSPVSRCPRSPSRRPSPTATRAVHRDAVLSDHSAFDAYSLLVEADGRRLFYTSDIGATAQGGNCSTGSSLRRRTPMC